MSDLPNILQVLMSFFVEAGGQGIGRGGKGMLLSGFRKIGWAKAEEGKGGRITGHKLGGHALGSGGTARANLTNYNPKTDLQDRMAADFNRGRRSGSDIKKASKKGNMPSHLHGRSVFTGAESLTGESTGRWVKQGNNSKSVTRKPRSFIKF